MRTLSVLVACVSAVALGENLPPKDFQAALQKTPGVVLDVRTPDEVARGTIAGASVIDFHDPKFEQKAALLAKDRPVYVYCASGGRSGQAAQKLEKLGFQHVVNLEGGLRAWTAAGLPVAAATSQPVAAASETTPATFDAFLAKHDKVLVDFHTPWCTPCQQMAPVVASLKLPGAEVLSVDVDASEALAAREKVEGVPVFVLYVKGKATQRLSGVQTKAALEAMAK